MILYRSIRARVAWRVVFVGILASILPAALSASILPPGFQERVVVPGLVEPTSVSFGPNGDLWVSGRRGSVWLVRGGGCGKLGPPFAGHAAVSAAFCPVAIPPQSDPLWFPRRCGACAGIPGRALSQANLAP